MIQRIQTLYLLIIAALMAVTLFSGLAWFAGDAGEFGLYAFGLKTAEGELVQSTVYMGVLLALACNSSLQTHRQTSGMSILICHLHPLLRKTGIRCIVLLLHNPVMLISPYYLRPYYRSLF